MKSLPLFFLHPVFDHLAENLKPFLSERFDFIGYHLDDLPQLLDQAEAPWIFWGDQETFTYLQEHFPAAPFYCFLYLDHEASLKESWLNHDNLLDYSHGLPSAERLTFSLNRIYSQSLQAFQIKSLKHQLDVQRDRLHELNQIGTALSNERNLDHLLDKILTSSTDITCSDSGSLYLVETREEDAQESRYLRFKWARNLSLEIDFSEFTIDLNEQSIAGAVALQGKALNIQDVYEMDPGLPYGFNKSFDQNTGYRSKSMLTVPMKNPKGDVIGILQMINKNRDPEQPLSLKDAAMLETQIQSFTDEDEELLVSLASQAAVAIENARLYSSIQSLFEGFIKASVKAIESRDPTTSGHSERVAILTVGLAKKIDRISDGPYAQVSFSRNDLKEIKYASLLHDFGKIGVREHVLVKADKLYTHELDEIKHRFRLIRKSLENQMHVNKLNVLLKQGPAAAQIELAEIEGLYQTQVQSLDYDYQMVVQANRPSILDEEVSEHLKLLEQKIFEVDQDQISLLNPYELSRLSIKKGTLAPEERLEIESHVTHTFHFLSQIPWTRELRNVPQIAYAHHEKLNGHGYPLGLPAAEIPIQARMMTISDIYDALTASDRPYKKALPAQRALDILGFEVKDGMLDADLYQVFKESKVYEEIAQTAE